MARYGREQRGRAVDLYVRYERCAVDVIRELGHPGKGALLSWYADQLEEERTRGGDAQEEAPDGRGEESRRGDYGVGKHADVRIRASGHGGSGGHAGVHGGQTRALAGPSGRTGRRCRTAAAGEEGAGHRDRDPEGHVGAVGKRAGRRPGKARPATRRRSSSNRPVRSSA